MHPKIKEQKELMQKAIDIIRKIEIAKELFKDLDPNISRAVVKDYKFEYYNIMDLLLQNMVSISGKPA